MNRNYRKLLRGTFLGDEKWEIVFTLRGNSIIWIGVSTLSVLHWKGRPFECLLDQTLNLEEAQIHFLQRLTEEIPVVSIDNLAQLEIQIHVRLVSKVSYLLSISRVKLPSLKN